MVGMVIVSRSQSVEWSLPIGHDNSAPVDEVRATMRPLYYGFPIFLVWQFMQSINRRRWRRRADRKKDKDSEELSE
jgi:hypothetical protein